MDDEKEDSISKGFKFALGIVLFIVIFFWLFKPTLVAYPIFSNENRQDIPKTNTHIITTTSNEQAQASQEYKTEIGYLNQAIKIHDFEMANFVYQPSYVSFESALNYWGILSQFPFEITSATLKTSREKKIGGKLYGYNKVDKRYYGGFIKVDGFLVATKEKALVDQIYLWSKGLKQLNWNEYDLSRVDNKLINKMLVELKIYKKLERYIGKLEGRK